MKKHPYYDSNKRKRTEKHALQAITWSFGILVIIGLILIISKWL